MPRNQTNLSFVLTLLCVFLLLYSRQSLAEAQDPAQDSTAETAKADQETVSGTLDLKLPGVFGDSPTSEAKSSQENGQKGDPEDRDLTPEEEAAKAEYLAELDKRTGAFRDEKAKLVTAMGELRRVMILYANGEERTPKAAREHKAKRAEVRQLLNTTYDNALDVLRIGYDEDSAKFVLTMVQHRHDHSIYDVGTAEGAARLIDGGSEFLFLVHTGARSAMVAGMFDVASKLYNAVSDDQLEEVDLGMKYSMEALKKQFEREQELRKLEEEADNLPRVKIETTQGDIVVELFLNEAPSTVSNFLRLVKEGFYEDVDFHQVEQDLLALTGDPTGMGDGGSGKFILDEHTREDARFGLRGSLVMAKKPMGPPGQFFPNSGSSQFAILYLPFVGIHKDQTVFGRVIEGMEVVSRLNRVDPTEKKEKKVTKQTTDRVISATILRAPEQLPEPDYFDVNAAIEEERAKLLEQIMKDKSLGAGKKGSEHDHAHDHDHDHDHGSANPETADLESKPDESKKSNASNE